LANEVIDKVKIGLSRYVGVAPTTDLCSDASRLGFNGKTLVVIVVVIAVPLVVVGDYSE
jgi:hypothetical protein